MKLFACSTACTAEMCTICSTSQPTTAHMTWSAGPVHTPAHTVGTVTPLPAVECLATLPGCMGRSALTTQDPPSKCICLVLKHQHALVHAHSLDCADIPPCLKECSYVELAIIVRNIIAHAAALSGHNPTLTISASMSFISCLKASTSCCMKPTNNTACTTC